MTTNLKCYRCGKTKALKKCNCCNTIFCGYCAAPTIKPGSNIQETVSTCLECGSDNIIHIEDGPSEK